MSGEAKGQQASDLRRRGLSWRAVGAEIGLSAKGAEKIARAYIERHLIRMIDEIRECDPEMWPTGRG